MLRGITWQNAIALAVVIIMCGFLAYWGDLLGRRMGKRRLSLLGLRPKHTAIAITTITGMLIALLTISIMAATSQRVRLLMLRGLEIVSERKQMDKQLLEARDAYNHAKTSADVARAEALEAMKKKAVIIAERDRLTKSLASLKAELHANQASLARASKQLSKANVDQVLARKQIADERAEIKMQKIAIAGLESKRVRLVAIGRQLADDTNEAMKRLGAMKIHDVAFRPGDELARGTIKCAQSKGEIKREVLAVIDHADKRARQEGVGLGINGRSVKILPVEFGGRLIPDSELVDAITDNISAGKGSVVARVISLSNNVEGDEPALVNVILNPSRLVYKAGDEVASINVDGTKSRGVIFGTLVGFFKTHVRPIAISKGVIPTTDDEGQLSVGQIPGDMLIDLIDKIKAEGRSVSLKAVALKDTWSADNLVLDVKVGDAN